MRGLPAPALDSIDVLSATIPTDEATVPTRAAEAEDLPSAPQPAAQPGARGVTLPPAPQPAVRGVKLPPAPAVLRRLSGNLVRIRGDRDPLWRQALLIGWLCWLYDMLTELAPTRRTLAIANGRGALALERSLGISPELALDRWLAHQQTLGLLLSDYYDNAHFVVTLGLVGWLWWRRSDIYVPLRNALVLMNVIAFAVFLLYPVAPPRMLVGDGFADVVAATHAFGSWHTGSLAGDADQYAAMPSLHIAWATWCAVAIWRMTRRRTVRALGVLHVVLTGFIVLATGNHYLLDVLGGFATAVLSFALVALAGRLRRRLANPGMPADS
jgi:membrane-associated phospholipid phosphatase